MEAVNTETMEVIRSEIMVITPELANKLLEGNIGNRKIKQAVVKKYTDAILSGDFICTNNGIGLDKDGRLIDGQHRLTAVVKSGKSIKQVVCYYTNPGTAKYIPIDSGIKRTFSDFTGINKTHAAMVYFFVRDIFNYSDTQSEAKRFIANLGDKISILENFPVYHKKYLRIPILTAIFYKLLNGEDYVYLLEDMASLSLYHELSRQIYKIAMSYTSIGSVDRRVLFCRTVNVLSGNKQKMTEKRMNEIYKEVRSYFSCDK